MAWIFRKRIKLAKGISLNISKSGIGVSAGGKGLTLSAGKRGAYLNANVPGTGLSNRTKIGQSDKGDSSASCKIHLIPPGCPKIPPCAFKSGGGWLQEMKLLASKDLNLKVS